jgi:predicted transposase YdaD
MVRTPHDALFKRTFSDPVHAAGELRSVLPAALTAQMDFDDLRVESGSYVDQELGERHSDLLYSVPLGSQRALIYLLFEHQSGVDPKMLFRLLRYMVRIWERWLKAHPEAERLPPLIPVVLYHGAEQWWAPVAFEGLIDLDGEAAQAAAPFVPHFRCALDDLSRFTSEDLRNRSATALARLALFLLKGARHDPDLVDRLWDWAEAWRAVWSAPDGLATLQGLIRYILLVNAKATPQRMQKLLGSTVGPEVQEVVMTVGQQLIEQGMVTGFEKGIEQGMVTGIEKGIETVVDKNRRLLLRLVHRRFGELAPARVLQVEAADGDQIERWIEAILVAESVEALFAPTPTPPG